jgi:hypothetical protein
MRKFVAKHAAVTTGTLSCFDRGGVVVHARAAREGDRIGADDRSSLLR